MRKPPVLVLAFLCAVGGTSSATSVKWDQEVEVAFEPGSSTVRPEDERVLERLISNANSACARWGIEVVAAVERLEGERRLVRTTPRTASVRAVLERYGVDTRRIFEEGEFGRWPERAADKVEVQIVCTPGG